MQRYFLDNHLFTNNEVKADNVMLKHISKVMRNKVGDKVICVNKNGESFLCSIKDVENGQLEILEKLLNDNELDVEVTLIYGLPKGDKFEFILQKSTELGVSKIVPFLSIRSLIKINDKWHKKKERYMRIIQEASEQSHRSIIPEIEDPIKINDLKNYLSEINLVAYEESSREGEDSMFSQSLNHLTKSITIIVGPEGGFDQKEIDTMIDLGIKPCSLGKRILRSETAPLYMLSVIGFKRELMK